MVQTVLMTTNALLVQITVTLMPLVQTHPELLHVHETQGYMVKGINDMKLMNVRAMQITVTSMQLVQTQLAPLHAHATQVIPETAALVLKILFGPAIHI